MTTMEGGAGTPERAKVVIIGAGPAGYTAAIYSARAGLEPVLFEGGGCAIEPITLPGRQLMITTEIENYPGFPGGLPVPELMALFKAQAARFGTRIRTADVTSVDLSERPFRLMASDGDVMAGAVAGAKNCRRTSTVPAAASERRPSRRSRTSGTRSVRSWRRRWRPVAKRIASAPRSQ